MLKMYMVIIFIIFVEGSFNVNHLPLIYPNQADITVDLNTNLTLGCRSTEPITWTFEDDINKPSNKSWQMRYILNKLETYYKYEVILTVPIVSYINVGFYYCHAIRTDIDTPCRSDKIYVYVRGSPYLSVITENSYIDLNYNWYQIYPCRPNSPDIRVELICKENNLMYSFHPYVGFKVDVTTKGYDKDSCRCTFYGHNNNTFNTLLVLPALDSAAQFVYSEDTYIVNVGSNVTLKYERVLHINFPYFKYQFYWLFNYDHIRNFYKKSVALKKFKLKEQSIFINTLTIENITTKDEGLYICGSNFDYITYLFNVFVYDKNVNYTFPNIINYDDEEYVLKNLYDNLTLCCESTYPVKWTFSRKGFQLNDSHVYKNGSNYKTCLHISQIHVKNVGFYYCHEKNSIYNHPFKSSKIYVFVNYSITDVFIKPKESRRIFKPYSNVTIPCLPVSPKIVPTLTLINAENASLISTMIYDFDPRYGFLVRMPAVSVFAKCEFKTSSFLLTYLIEGSHSNIFEQYKITFSKIYESYPFISGKHKDVILGGTNLELICTALVKTYISSDVLQWIIPTCTSSKSNISTEIVDVTFGKIIISKLFAKNVSTEDEGSYICHLKHNNKTAKEYISIFDSFDIVRPVIENLLYSNAYYGQKLILTCNVYVDHNVEFDITWNISNFNSLQEETIIIHSVKKITNLRNVLGQRILEIRNVTYAHNGTYTCNILDSTNRIRSTSKNIQVKQGKKPQILRNHLKQVSDKDVDIGDKVIFNCPNKGDPPPIIIWRKGPTVLQEVPNHIIYSKNKSELTIPYALENDTGLYSCTVENIYGKDSLTINFNVTRVLQWKTLTAAIIIFIAVILLATILFFIRKYRNKKFRKDLLYTGLINYNFDKYVEEQCELLFYDKKFEIPKNNIVIEKNLDSGYFGLVAKGTILDYSEDKSAKTVAVKMLHPNSSFADLKMLISELEIMVKLGTHKHLINLLGASTENILSERNLYIIVEYCKFGNLQNFLMENRIKFIDLIQPETGLICLSQDKSTYIEVNSLQFCVTNLKLLFWASQVAEGMEYLVSQKILHGDLAARNILLTEDYTVKISDFGLSKILFNDDVYVKKSCCPLPVKWMAIESIRSKVFSSQSDVWSFGIVLWEMFSLGRTPYPDMEPNFHFFRKLDSGYRMEKPEHATKEIYQVMLDCWHKKPACRPAFTELVKTFSDLINMYSK